MQRGAQLRDRRIHPSESTYHLKSPRIRDEDLVFFGGSDRFPSFALEFAPTIKGLARNGFRKPAQVAAILNKQGKRTPSGDFWNPRLVWFLLGEIYKDVPRKNGGQGSSTKVTESITFPGKEERTRPNRQDTPEQIQRNRGRANIQKVALTEEEMQRRRAVLKKL